MRASAVVYAAVNVDCRQIWHPELVIFMNFGTTSNTSTLISWAISCLFWDILSRSTLDPPPYAAVDLSFHCSCGPTYFECPLQTLLHFGILLLCIISSFERQDDCNRHRA
jgi:hypothetical protein